MNTSTSLARVWLVRRKVRGYDGGLLLSEKENLKQLSYFKSRDCHPSVSSGDHEADEGIESARRVSTPNGVFHWSGHVTTCDEGV